MKLILILLITWGCTHQPYREPAGANDELALGSIDITKSVIRLFEDSQLGDDEYAFYIEALDQDSNHIDVLEHDLKIFHSGRTIPFSLERVSRGHFILSLEIFSLKGLKIFIQGRQVKDHFKKLPAPIRQHSSINILKKNDNELKLILILKDKNNQPVISPISPDIIIEGFGQIEDLKQGQEGIWTFNLVFPEQNQVLYLSVRSNGGYLPKIFRFHHVEK
jgi:hypothetical protein